MRFHADGPNIPLDLLEARDRGEVVFFCGAGVSAPAGLPDFRKLTRLVMKDLGVPAGHAAREILDRDPTLPPPAFEPPMDQLMAGLQEEYGVALVEAKVSHRLRTPRRADLSRHLTVLKLSAGVDGNRRVVTTNFDHLFEKADRRLPTYRPPRLPDLTYGDPEGVIYLHGRADFHAGPRTRQGLVLGAGDFGRAYLAEGWATRFVRQLVERQTVVLLGYSADDPPVRYLLEGLRSGGGLQPTMYTFAEGSQADAEAKWVRRGVHPIAYSALDRGHSGLWRSLEAWAERAGDPEGWRCSIATMAQHGPLALEPHQRGQVAALVLTTSGARAFYEAEPPPPAEWLCVFDAYRRYAKPGANLFTPEEEFDPLAAYGLDSDPPRDEAAKGEDPPPGLDMLAPSPVERQMGGGFAGLASQVWAPLPPRLQQLAWWCGRVAFEPATLWWAGKQPALHPTVQQAIERAISRNLPPERLLHARWWGLLLERVRDIRDLRRDWYALIEEVKVHGWTPANLRELAKVLEPRLSIDRSLRLRPRPPGSADPLRYLVNFDVEFLTFATDELSHLHARLPEAVRIWRNALLQGASLLSEAVPIVWRTPTLYPGDHEGHQGARDAGPFFLHFARLFDRLADESPEAARRELRNWPTDDPFFFEKLRIWAARRPDLYNALEAFELFNGLDGDAFWNGELQREVLRTLRQRWGDFSEDSRKAMEAKILGGPPRWQRETDEGYDLRRKLDPALRLGWLQQQGCELSAETHAALPGLRAAEPKWTEEWDANADRRGGGVRTEWGETDTDPTPLLTLPVSQILVRDAQVAEDRPDPLRQNAPFAGLVATRPGRALAAMGYAGRHGEAPSRAWQAFLEAHEPPLTPRMRVLAAWRLSRLPAKSLVDLRFYVGRWLQAQIADVAASSPEAAWAAWDAFFKAIVDAGPSATTSGIGDSSIGGVPQRLSRRTHSHASSGPIGQLVDAALIVLEARSPTPKSTLPDDVRDRVEAAMLAPGEGGDHAVSIVMANMIWLDGLDPSYARDRLSPLLDPGRDLAEPAWSGFLTSQQTVPRKLFLGLKAHFLRVFATAEKWRWPSPFQGLAGLLIGLRLSPRTRYLSGDDVREALQTGGEPACSGALSVINLAMLREFEWPAIRRIFASWPLEARCQSEMTSRQMVNVALESADDFPDVVRTILPFLQPTDRSDLFMLHFRQDGEDGSTLATRFPEPALALLDAVAPAAGLTVRAYDLKVLLEAIVEADSALRQDPRFRRLRDLCSPP